VRRRVEHCLLSCHHPVDAVAACDVELPLLLMTTAVAAGSNGIATAGVARGLLIQMAGSSWYSIVSAVVIVSRVLVSPFLLLIYSWRKVTHQLMMTSFPHHRHRRRHHMPPGEEIGMKLRWLLSEVLVLSLWKGWVSLMRLRMMVNLLLLLLGELRIVLLLLLLTAKLLLQLYLLLLLLSPNRKTLEILHPPPLSLHLRHIHRHLRLTNLHLHAHIHIHLLTLDFQIQRWYGYLRP
jgi:hypothetical protein